MGDLEKPSFWIQLITLALIVILAIGQGQIYPRLRNLKPFLDYGPCRNRSKDHRQNCNPKPRSKSPVRLGDFMDRCFKMPSLEFIGCRGGEGATAGVIGDDSLSSASGMFLKSGSAIVHQPVLKYTDRHLAQTGSGLYF